MKKVLLILCLIAMTNAQTSDSPSVKGMSSVKGMGKYPFWKYLMQLMTGFSSRVDRLQNTQNQLSRDLTSVKVAMARRQLTVNKQLGLLRQQRKCQSGTQRHYTKFNKWPAVRYIKFNPPFSATPSFVYGITSIDSHANRNVRAVASISGLTRTGFTLRLNKWSNTIMYGLHVSWMACPK